MDSIMPDKDPVNPTPPQACLLHAINDYRRQRGRTCAALLESERQDRPTITALGLVDLAPLYDEINRLEALCIVTRNLIRASLRAEHPPLMDEPAPVHPLVFVPKKEA